MLRVEFGLKHLYKAFDLILRGAPVLIERPHILKNIGHLENSIVPALRCASMAGYSLYIYTDLHPPTVSAVNASVCRLG